MPSPSTCTDLVRKFKPAQIHQASRIDFDSFPKDIPSMPVIYQSKGNYQAYLERNHIKFKTPDGANFLGENEKKFQRSNELFSETWFCSRQISFQLHGGRRMLGVTTLSRFEIDYHAIVKIGVTNVTEKLSIFTCSPMRSEIFLKVYRANLLASLLWMNVAYSSILNAGDTKELKYVIRYLQTILEAKFNIPDDFLSTYGVIDGALGVYFPIGKKPYVDKREVYESFVSLRSSMADSSLNGVVDNQASSRSSFSADDLI